MSGMGSILASQMGVEILQGSNAFSGDERVHAHPVNRIAEHLLDLLLKIVPSFGNHSVLKTEMAQQRLEALSAAPRVGYRHERNVEEYGEDAAVERVGD